MPDLTSDDLALIDDLVTLYNSKKTKVQGFLEQIQSAIEGEMADGGRLSGLIHSTKGRVKDETHLRLKLERKIKEGYEKGVPYDVTRENFFYKVTDLAAYRIMHLHPKQMEELHPALMALFEERQLQTFEDPSARVWDLETERFYEKVVGIQKIIHTTDKLYTSVHYVLVSNWKNKFTCEIQVRTLADEVWGEVDHSLNYPDKHQSIACKEQIKSLAHVTTSCNRLVDSIFASSKEWDDRILKEQAERAALSDVSQALADTSEMRS